MIKYVIAQTGEPVSIGSVISESKEINTTFGTIKTETCIKVTEDNIADLVQHGIIKEVKKPNKSKNNDLGYYVSKLAKRYNKSFEEVIEWLNATNRNVCPKIVLDILLLEISEDFRRKDFEAFTNADIYYGISSKDGKVEKLTKSVNYYPSFKSIEDAEAAREILKDQLKLMYGE